MSPESVAMKRLILIAGMGLLLIPGAAAAQYGGDNIGTQGYQTGVVDAQPSDDDAQIGVDDGSGIIQGRTELEHKAKKKKKDPNCKWVDKKGYREKNCW
jgi:hypothetical protein